jgi:Mrp family chromosome partitioning ATPase
MGRMLDALRRADVAPNDREQTRPRLSAVAPTTDAEPILVASEEIPFIEVGPRKSMEASASVLACTPVAAPLHVSIAPALETRVDPIPSVPVLRSVQFRSLPGRAVPHAVLAPELVAFHNPDGVGAQQYREVLDSVLNAAETSDRPTAFLFVSALPRSGTTTTLLNLAITAACRRRPCVVVDANFRNPSVAERLGLPSAPGLREVMAGTVALEEALQTTEQDRLLVLTAGVHESSGVRFLAEPLRSLLRHLRQRHPLVFVDGPRWDGKPDVTTLAVACDAVFLVTPESEVETPQTDALLRLIPERGARLIGCILVADPSPVR